MAKVHQVRLSRDLSCFTTCGEDGFRIFNVEPLLQLGHISESEIGGGKVLQAEILNRSNLVAIVCKNCDYAVMLWDCALNKCRREVTFDQEVTNIRFHHDKLIVVLRTRIILFSYSPDLVKVHSYDTRLNPWGVMAVNSGTTAQVLAFPDSSKTGTVQVEDIPTNMPLANVMAHEHELACITLNSDGSYMATASKHGTLIRVFYVRTGQKFLELRRGSNTALVYSLNFSFDSKFLCAASDKGTVHIFAIHDRTLNRKSALENVAGLVTPYSKSQWGVASFTIAAEMACVCSFISDKRTNVMVVCVDGSYHKYSFSPDASSCRPELYERYIDLGDSMEM